MMDTLVTTEGMSYTGDIVSSSNYDPPDSIRMSTDIKDFPFRVIMKKNIRSLDGKPFDFKVTKDRVIKVKGSNGNEYTVKESGGTKTCSCPGFQFRKTCKHLKELE